MYVKPCMISSSNPFASVYRVNFLRAKARFDRWDEEMENSPSWNDCGVCYISGTKRRQWLGHVEKSRGIRWPYGLCYKQAKVWEDLRWRPWWIWKGRWYKFRLADTVKSNMVNWPIQLTSHCGLLQCDRKQVISQYDSIRELADTVWSYIMNRPIQLKMYRYIYHQRIGRYSVIVYKVWSYIMNRFRSIKKCTGWLVAAHTSLLHQPIVAYSIWLYRPMYCNTVWLYCIGRLWHIRWDCIGQYITVWLHCVGRLVKYNNMVWAQWYHWFP